MEKSAEITSEKLGIVSGQIKSEPDYAHGFDQHEKLTASIDEVEIVEIEEKKVSSSFLSDLACFTRKSFRYITETDNSSVVSMQDENGDTLLHHLARYNIENSSTEIYIFLNILSLEKRKLYFEQAIKTKNYNGETPLHIAAKESISYRGVAEDQRKRNHEWCPIYLWIRLASECGFDFSTTDNAGRTFLYNSVTVADSSSPYYRIRNCPLTIINVFRDLKIKVPLDDVSLDEKTALSHAIDSFCMDEASSLLEAGYDPFSDENDYQLIDLIEKKKLAIPFPDDVLISIAAKILGYSVLKEGEPENLSKEAFLEERNVRRLRHYEKIYTALRGGQTTFFNTGNYLERLAGAESVAEKIHLIEMNIKNNSKSRTASAWHLACKYENLEETELAGNRNLFLEIYKESFCRSALFSCSYLTGSVLLFNRQVKSIKIDDIKNDHLSQPSTRSGKILSGLGRA